MCGIIGVIATQQPKPKNVDQPHTHSSGWAAQTVYHGLIQLQHRRQYASEILCFDDIQHITHSHKTTGLVKDGFDKAILKRLKGTIAIANTRYATIGNNNLEDIQPQA